MVSMSPIPPNGFLMHYLWWWIITVSVGLHTWCFFCLSRDWNRKRRLIAGNALITLNLLLIAGTVGETWFRYFHLETHEIGLTLGSRRWLAVCANRNPMGYRDEIWPVTKPTATRRIAFVGDSFTFGWGINDPRDRFTDLIERRFAESGEPMRVEVMNVGKPGTETGEHIDAIRKMIEGFDVDEAVLCYCFNDIDDLTRSGETPRAPYPPPGTFTNLESSFLLDYLYVQLVARPSPGMVDYFDRLARTYWDPQSWSIQCYRFDLMIRLCREKDVDFRVALLPMPRNGKGDYDPYAVHARVAGFFESRSVPVVDLLPTVKGIPSAELVVNSRDYHPNERANSLFADHIWEAFYARKQAGSPGDNGGMNRSSERKTPQQRNGKS